MYRNRIIRELRQELYRELNCADPENFWELRNHHQALRQKYFELCLQFEDLLGMTQQEITRPRGKLFAAPRPHKK